MCSFCHPEILAGFTQQLIGLPCVPLVQFMLLGMLSRFAIIKALRSRHSKPKLVRIAFDHQASSLVRRMWGSLGQDGGLPYSLYQPCTAYGHIRMVCSDPYMRFKYWPKHFRPTESATLRSASCNHTTASSSEGMMPAIGQAQNTDRWLRGLALIGW